MKPLFRTFSSGKMKKQQHQKQIQTKAYSRSSFSSLSFILKSIYLAVTLTFPPLSFWWLSGSYRLQLQES